ASVVPAASLPSTNDPNAEFTAKRSLIVYDNVGQEVLLDIFFTRTGTGTPGTTMAGPAVGGYSASLPNSTTAGPAVGGYTAASTPIANGANSNFTFAGFTGLTWVDGDATSFTVDINGTAVDVTGIYSGGTWSFAPDNPAAVPAGATLTFDASGPDLVVNAANATGAGINVAINGFSSTRNVPGIADGANADLTFAGFTGLAWADGDTASFTVDIDGTAVEVTGTYSGGAWSFTPDDPASVPTGATLSFDTSGPDLVVNVANATGAGITVSANGFTSTTPVPATADTWEMSIFYQPNAAATTSFPYSQPALQTATLEFDQYGKLIGPATVGIDLTGLNGEMIEMDISGMTQLAAEFTQGDVGKNGTGPASIDSVVIGTDGILYAKDAKGNTTPLYRLPIATVQSPDQLQVLPGNVFSVGLESGDVQIGFAGSGGLGDIISGSVENSNVDIAEELTNMIESQRNYTANSKVFQTGSDLMDVLVNLKR
ncbi:MAG: flagellar hook-basal body complex protein, partial [Aquamicrobium sp.]|nr:flagellar hook-basal body complex protein [Aquamicrobium sp.]